MGRAREQNESEKSKMPKVTARRIAARRSTEIGAAVLTQGRDFLKDPLPRESRSGCGERNTESTRDLLKINVFLMKQDSLKFPNQLETMLKTMADNRSPPLTPRHKN